MLCGFVGVVFPHEQVADSCKHNHYGSTWSKLWLFKFTT